MQKTGWIFHTERKKSEEVENHGHAWVLCKNETIRMDFIEELPSIFRFLFSVHSEDEVNSRNTAGKMLQLISSKSNENEEEDNKGIPNIKKWLKVDYINLKK